MEKPKKPEEAIRNFIKTIEAIRKASEEARKKKERTVIRQESK